MKLYFKYSLAMVGVAFLTCAVFENPPRPYWVTEDHVRTEGSTSLHSLLLHDTGTSIHIGKKGFRPIPRARNTKEFVTVAFRA